MLQEDGQPRLHLSELPAHTWGERDGLGLCLGFFDGVHRGHQELLRRLVYACTELNLKPSVLTFDFVPKLQATTGDTSGHHAKPLLQTFADRMHRMEEYGVEQVFLQTFNDALAHMSPEQFLETVLVEGIGVKLIVVGYDFHFGYRMKGDAAVLRAFCESRGIPLIVVDPVRLAGEPIHSTAIREAVRAGDLRRVQALTGRPYSVRGTVITGNALGRRLGIPTANIPLREVFLLPPIGVYSTWTRIGSRLYPGISSLGLRPTVIEEKKELLLETHIFDFDTSLYGREIEVFFVERLREELRFDSLEEMQQQILEDCRRARNPEAEAEQLLLWDTLGDVPVYLLPTNRFRTGQARIRLSLPMDEQNAARAVALCCRADATIAHPTREKFNQALNRLYGAALEEQVRKEGDLHVCGLALSALLRGPDGSHPFEETLSLALDCLLDPWEDEAQSPWNEDLFAVEKQGALDEWDSMLSNKPLWAWNQAISQAYEGTAFGSSPLGNRESLESLTLADCREAWKRLLGEADVAIYLACPPDEEILDLLRQRLSVLPQNPARFRELPGRRPSPCPEAKTGDKTEYLPLEQSRLCWLWQAQTPAISWEHLNLVFLNNLMGGDAHALLFEKVREEMGLAYEISSHYLADRRAFVITAGVHPGSEEAACAAIREQLDCLARGAFSERQFESSRKMLLSQLLLLRDSLGSLLGYFIRQQRSGLELTPELQARHWEKLEREELVHYAATLKPALCYRLLPEAKGGETV